MANMIFLIFIYFTGWLIVFSYARSIYEVKGRHSWILSVVLYSFLMIIFNYVTNYEAVNILLTILCNILLLFLCFNTELNTVYSKALKSGQPDFFIYPILLQERIF